MFQSCVLGKACVSYHSRRARDVPWAKQAWAGLNGTSLCLAGMLRVVERRGG